MAHEVLLPKQGNTVESCIIIDWAVSEGDTVAEGQKLCEVETDKATFEVESTASGTVLKLLYGAGDEAPVLAPIAVVGEPGEEVAGGATSQPGSEAASATAGRVDAGEQDGGATGAGAGQEAAVHDSGSGHGRPAHGGVAGAAGKDPAARDAGGTATGVDGIASGAGAGAPAESEKPRAARTRSGKMRVSPRARQRAQALGIDPAALEGSGPGGRVLVRDVEAAAAAGVGRTAAAGAPDRTAAATAARDAAATATVGARGLAGGGASGAAGLADSAEPEVVGETPLRGIRARIAERMHASLRDTAQLSIDMTADARGLQALRARFKADGERLGLPPVSIGDMVNFAAARVLKRHPALNSHIEAERIVHYGDVHLGLAVDTERGLLVPTVAHADKRSLAALATESRRLAAAARDGSIQPDELTGATFTVTNLGAAGVRSFTPVLNPPQVAILGVCGIFPEPVFVENVGGAAATARGSGGASATAGGGAVAPGTAGAGSAARAVEHIPAIGLSLTIDHRAVDGAPAARFLKDLCDAIAAIELTLAI